MGVVLLVSLGFMALLGLPITTFLYAKHLGRNARAWLLVGILLPGIATIILSFLPDLSEDQIKTKEQDPEIN